MENQDEKEALFQQTYLKALLDNRNNIAHWKAFKERYEDVIKNLGFYNEKSQHSVCIPVGKKAFVKGQLVHTNDVWVTLGCGWFLKTSTKKAIEICDRRIKEANELIEKWEKESKLLESMRDYSMNKDTFGRESSKEIVEPFDEEQEKKWKQEHKEKERKYRQQLKELKEKTGSATLNDEKDIWEHLEALEIQEELEDELNRLGYNDMSSEDNESDSDDISLDEGSSSEETDSFIENNTKQSQRKLIEIIDPGETNKYNSNEITTSNESTISAGKPELKTGRKEKKVTFQDMEDSSSQKNNNAALPAQDAVLDTVVEKIFTESNKSETEPSRPVSKFKMKKLTSK